MELKITLPGAKLVEKMYETFIDHGIATFWTNRVRIRAEKANQEIERIKLLSAEQRKQDIKAMKDGKAKLINGELVQVDFQQGYDLQRIEQLATNSIMRDTIRKEINLAMAIDCAETSLLDQQPQGNPLSDTDKANGERPIDPDWLFRWREHASEVSQESMQRLWGKVLAGEIRQPGSVSLRTMDILKNLSKQDAELICKLFALVLNRSYIYRHEEYERESRFYQYHEVLYLEELGLIQGAQAHLVCCFNKPTPEFNGYVFTLFDMILMAKAKNGKTIIPFELPAYFLSQAGRELSCIGNFEPNFEYLKYIGQRLDRYNLDYTIFRSKYDDSGNRVLCHPETGEVISVLTKH